jgi:hypothetical protein
MGERAYLSSATARLAEAVYRQGRLDEAQRLTEEAEAAAPGDDFDAQARWRATRAKVLARCGQFPAARQLAEEAMALVSDTSYAALLAETLMAKAEVIGSPGRATKPRPASARHCGSTRNDTRCPSPSGPRPPSPASSASPALSQAKRPSSFKTLTSLDY